MARVFVGLLTLVHVSSFQILQPHNCVSRGSPTLNSIWRNSQHPRQIPSHSKYLEMTMNGVGEINRRKLVALLACTALSQFPTFQAGALESGGATGPEIIAKVYGLIHNIFFMCIKPPIPFLRYTSIY